MFDHLKEFLEEIEEEVLETREAIEEFRVRYLGRKNGRVTSLFKQMKDAPAETRKSLGQEINSLKQRAEKRIEEALDTLKDAVSPNSNDRDLSLPGRPVFLGSYHPITQTQREIERIFGRLGFDIAEGPELEDDWHNFTALNFPPDHPARDMQDTFFLEEGTEDAEAVVLRTHTSPAQIRIMKSQKPPIRVIVPGRVYRNESITYKSYCVFHQVEGLFIDEKVSLADLRHVLDVFARTMFGNDVKTRFRPNFFPFTEPSAEMDIWWADPDLPGGGRWMEILGSGMVDPNVLEAVGIDSEKYTGYAFGMGIDRITLLKHDIKDIRVLFENDVRFLEQF